MTTALHPTNVAPEISAASVQTVLLDQAVDVGALFSVNDADGDVMTSYEFWDGTAGNGHFTVNGATQGVNQAVAVSAADLANTRFTGASATGSDQVWVRANDGQAWSGWKNWTMTSAPHLTNAAPTVAASNVIVLQNQPIDSAALFSVADADGDTITQYEFWDEGAGGGRFEINGVAQGSAQAISVGATDLANTRYVGGANPGTEQVWVRAYDGQAWSGWKNWNMTTALHDPNAAPVISASNQTVLLNQSVNVSGLFAVNDADGDAMTNYEFWDGTAGNGHFSINGVEQGANQAIAVSAANLVNTQFTAATTTSTDQVWVRANDGQFWSDWKSWNLTSAPHLTNVAPVVSAQTAGVLRGEARPVASLFSVNDADGDAITQYELWDEVSGGGQFRINGVQQAAGQTIAVAATSLADTDYLGGANAGSEQVWARAYDGQAWSDWKNWQMSTEGGLVRGGAGPDILLGEAGPTIMEGGDGNDTLTDTEGNNLFSGGAGDDNATGGDGNDLFVAGPGNDTIHTGAGNNVIALNGGDGVDAIYSDAGASNTLSLGGGTNYADLGLSKCGNDLVLDTGNGGQAVLKDWYAGRDNAINLQVVLDATAAFDANSSDPMLNQRVQNFDFRGIVSAFDAQRALNPGLSNWALSSALLNFHLSGSDNTAIGGDLAYQYGNRGTLAGFGNQSAFDTLAAQGFGVTAQTLKPFSGLQEGLVKLQ
jgi:hypothetical protein